MVQTGTPEQYFGYAREVAIREPIQVGSIPQPIEAKIVDSPTVIDFSWDNVLKAIALIGAIGIILYVFYITYKGK